MSEISSIIEKIEQCNATEQVVTPDEINEVLVSLGGEPICITNKDSITMGEGSLTSEILLYMTLLITRTTCGVNHD